MADRTRNPSPTYAKIVRAVKSKKLKEPFVPHDLVRACRIGSEAASSYPSRHRRGNPQKKPAYFERTKGGKYRLVRPFKYGL